MTTWAEFEAAEAAMAAAGRALLYRGGDGEALLATVRGEEPPRIHPVNVGIVDGALYAFILRSAKLIDLERDGRYALHAHVDPDAPPGSPRDGRRLARCQGSGPRSPVACRTGVGSAATAAQLVPRDGG